MILFIGLCLIGVGCAMLAFAANMGRLNRAAEIEENRRFAFRQTERDLGLEPWVFGPQSGGGDWDTRADIEASTIREMFRSKLKAEGAQKRWERQFTEAPGGVMILEKGATYRPFETTAGPAQRLRCLQCGEAMAWDAHRPGEAHGTCTATMRHCDGILGLVNRDGAADWDLEARYTGLPEYIAKWGDQPSSPTADRRYAEAVKLREKDKQKRLDEESLAATAAPARVGAH